MMCRTGRGRTWPAAAGLAILAAALAGPGQAQPGAAPKGAAPIGSDLTRIRVPITTADGLELDGTFYQSNKAGRDSACVMLVHRFGENRTKSEWASLAGELQAAGYAVLTFDLRGHGGSTQLSNPQLFWSLPYNRNGIIGGTATTKKSAVSFTDFKPSYVPFMVNDLAAARRFLEQKNDAGELNIHSLIIIGAETGADLGFLFAAAEYSRVYKIGVTALQSNGTSYNAGEDLAAGVWLGLTNRPPAPAGAPPFQFNNWVKSHPRLREKTPMCFVYADGDRTARMESETVYRVLTGPMAGSPDKHKLDELKMVPRTNLPGQALLGQQALGVSTEIVGYCKKVLADRRAIAWTEVKPEVNVLQLVPLVPFGFRMP
jgi:pimeloyl-ACP methyl ester carboxylesterase